MMDIWMVTCVGFVFAAMAEFVIVKCMHNISKKRAEAQEQTEAEFLKKHATKAPVKPNGPENDFLLTKAGVRTSFILCQYDI